MGSKVHYEDNLFFVHAILKTVQSGLRLDIDADFFRDKVVEDVFFVDATLMRTFASLKENAFLINRSSHLRSLRRTVVAFVDFLESFSRGDLGFPEAVHAYQDRLAAALRGHQQVRREIDGILDQQDMDDETVNVISSQEYGFLLASDDSDEDDTASS